MLVGGVEGGGSRSWGVSGGWVLGLVWEVVEGGVWVRGVAGAGSCGVGLDASAKPRPPPTRPRPALPTLI